MPTLPLEADSLARQTLFQSGWFVVGLLTQALPGAYDGWLVAILLGYGLLTSLMKRAYLRRYGWQ